MPAEQPSIEEIAARMVNEEAASMAKQIKDLSGTPYGVHNLTPAAELWAWGFEDDTVDVPTLRAQGIPDPEIAARRFPLQTVLMGQAGTTVPEQHAYADRLTERWLRARDAGRMPTPPARPKKG